MLGFSKGYYRLTKGYFRDSAASMKVAFKKEEKMKRYAEIQWRCYREYSGLSSQYRI